MKTSTKLKILISVVVIGALVAIFEFIGLATPLWHSISWYAQHSTLIFLIILAFFLALPTWWIYHILFHRVPK